VDFGEILKLWDAQERTPPRPAPRKTTSKKTKTGVETGDTSFIKANPVTAAQTDWLDRYGVPDPVRGDGGEAPEPRLSRRDIDLMPIDASLDLHGMTSREAEVALASFFTTAEHTGCRKVIIVHGKGLHSASEPVLESVVKRWLERRASAGRSGHADAVNGGKGATWVLMKRKGNQRSL